MTNHFRDAAQMFSEPLPSQWSTNSLLDRACELRQLRMAVEIAKRDLDYAIELLVSAKRTDKRAALRAVERAKRGIRKVTE